jgi:hypothetical protein
MNTMSTALYAALAAKSSALFALVKRLIEPEKNEENTIKSPMLSNVIPRPPFQVTRYMTNTGTVSRMMITKAMIKVVNLSIRGTE